MAALRMAWKSRNHRTTRRTAAQVGVETCALCGEELPNHCYWGDFEREWVPPVDIEVSEMQSTVTRRSWFCTEDCLWAEQVKTALKR